MDHSLPLPGYSVSGVSWGQLSLTGVFASGSHVPKSSDTAGPSRHVRVEEEAAR